MLSCMTDSPAGAIVTGVGLYITSQILDAIEPLGSLRYVLPTHYFDAWRDLIFEGHWTSDMARGALLMVGYVLLFTGRRGVVVPPQGHPELTRTELASVDRVYAVY